MKGNKSGRSAAAFIAEKVVRLSRPRLDEEALEKYMREIPKTNDVPYAIPKTARIKSPVTERLYGTMQIFIFNPDAAREPTLLYLHGGAYVRQPTVFHWRALDKIAAQTGCKILVPLYPKSPVHGFQESYTLLTSLYRDILTRHPANELIFMGDSSGGGLAVGLCQVFDQTGLPQPRKLILLSPWIDMTMDNPEIFGYAKHDPMLYPAAVEIEADCWAQGADRKDPKLSPINGELSMLKDVTVFTGTRELLYPDAMRFYEKLKRSGVHAELIVGENMNHDYPLYPIPEAKTARAQICARIRGS